MRTFRAFVWILSLSIVSVAGAKDIDYATAHLQRRIPAVRIQERITIDGLLNEAAWEKAPMVTDFIQSEPQEGEPATVRTEVRVLYDDSNLYIGFTCLQDEDKIIIADLKKDFAPTDGDVIGIVIDTFHDRRNGYEFAINAAGAKWDSQSSETERNANWDGVWFVKTRITDDRWFAEIAIPFRTLKFSNDSVQTWGINFLRRVRDQNEDSFWSPIPRIYRMNRISLAGTLEGLEGIQPSSNIRVKPYVVSSLGQTQSGQVRKSARTFEGGVDFKYGFGAGLTLDGTVNTDFSQVEADEQQVNLTRFSLFFPEKRDFFLENSLIFTFGSLADLTPRTPSSGSSGRQTSGGEDLIFFFSRRIGISDDGRRIPILGGARVSGRVGPWSVGFLNIQTRDSGPTPSTNFTAGRVRRNVGASSQIGAIVINKVEWQTGRFNRGYGADANIRIGQTVYLNGYYAKTVSPGKHHQDDSFRIATAFRNRKFDFRSVYTDIANNFNAEVGFVPRTGIKNWANYANVKFRPRRLAGWLREISPTVEREAFWTQANRLETRYFDMRVPFSFQDGAVFETGRNSSFERLFKPFRIQNNKRIAPGDFRFNDYYASYTSNRARKLSVNVKLRDGDFYDGENTTYTAGGTFRFSHRLTMTANYTRNNVRLPLQRFNTDLVTGRVNFSFSTKMFLNALLQYNTDARQWSSNVRFNIIHRPLSDFFLVYNERRDTVSGALIDRALIGKFTYMIGY